MLGIMNVAQHGNVFGKSIKTEITSVRLGIVEPSLRVIPCQSSTAFYD
jgi:hypothetical protein